MATPEGQIRDYLLSRCKHFNLTAYKLNFENRRGAPDWMVLGMGKHIFVELKSEDGKLSRQQEAVIDSMRLIGGCKVFVCAYKDDVDFALAELFV